MLRSRRQGVARCIYIPGNHDSFLRNCLRHAFAHRRGCNNRSPPASTASRYLLIHGDIFTSSLQKNAAGLPISATRPMIFCDPDEPHSVNFFRRIFGVHYGRCRMAKRKVKKAVNYSARSRRRWPAGRAAMTARRDLLATSTTATILRRATGIRYMNCGDSA